MEKLYILGFGCADKGEITLRTLDILRHSDAVFVRTMRHPAAEILVEYQIPYTAFDDIYDHAASFEAVYEEIAATIADCGERVVSYIVPGSAVFAERSVELLTQKCAGKYTIIPAVSFLDGIFSALGTDALASFKLLDALSLNQQTPDVTTTNLVAQVYSREIASDVKLELMKYYADDFPVILITAASSASERIERLPLCEIDFSENINHLTTLVLPPAAPREAPSAFASLKQVIDSLRDPITGCEWDRVQTHESLLKYLVEESYEFIDAAKKNNSDDMCEELGDVLLQVLLHASIASEQGEFDVYDVIRSECEKMIRRHPKVFGDGGNAPLSWEQIKTEEHDQRSIIEEMDALPHSFPPLLYARKLQDKAAKVRFDFDTPEEAMDKLTEEVGELSAALAEHTNIAEECADVLFACVNVARLCGIDESEALRSGCAKFLERFRLMNDYIERDGYTIAELGAQKADKYWKEAKNSLKRQKRLD